MRCTLLMPVLTEDAIVVRCTIPFLESASILGNTLIYILPSSTIMRSSPVCSSGITENTDGSNF